MSMRKTALTPEHLLRSVHMEKSYLGKAQIFDILKIRQNLPIVFQTLKVFMSSALMFKFMTTEFLIFP